MISSISRYICTLLLLTFTACHERAEWSGNSNPSNEEHISIAYLKSLCTRTSYTINKTLYIEGYVTANDLYNEFYKSIFIQDESEGIEIHLDAFKLYRRFGIGAKVRVYCDGLALGEHSGSISLGAKPQSEYVVDRIPESEIQRRILLLEDTPQAIEPIELTIGELTPRHIGKYITLHDVEFQGADSSLKWCDYSQEEGRILNTTRTLTDSDGNSIKLYTIGECDYADEPLPKGKGSICAILDYFNREYQLRVTNRGFQFE